MPNKTIGLYLHVPFCASKCPYCDFYSMRCDTAQKERYIQTMLSQTEESCRALSCKADTLYIGGGTPSLLGADALIKLVTAAKNGFLTEDAEITVECNPHALAEDFFEKLYAGGVNRISLGMQSAVDRERRRLGRRADCAELAKRIAAAKAAGFQNISLDVMLGIPCQTAESLRETLQFVTEQDVPHTSVYLLKLEEGTPFYKMQDRLSLPDDDTAADLYLQTVDTLQKNGLFQYEISNFAKTGFESRHNLKYWHCEEYLGLGPSAHSFLHGRRFFFPRDLEAFYRGDAPIADGTGGDFSEYAMLALRLTEGLQSAATRARFGHGIPDTMRRKAERYVKCGLAEQDEKGIRLLPQGFLVSNPILADLLENI